MTQHKLKKALLFIAASASLSSTFAQITSEPSAACNTDSIMTDKQLQGQWQGTISGRDEAVRIVLDPHPEWKGNVKGTIERPGSRYPMVGDVNQGSITLEESADGVHITGTWLGQAVSDSCAHEIQGEFQAGEDGPRQTFVLRKSQP